MLKIEPFSEKCNSDLAGGYLRSVEELVGKLPEKYTSFVIKYGNGRPSDDTVISHPEAGDLRPLIFFGDEREGVSLIEALEIHKDLRDDELLPFADDAYGNLFVLDIRNENVYFVEFASETKAYRIAENFVQFLDFFRCESSAQPDNEDNHK